MRRWTSDISSRLDGDVGPDGTPRLFTIKFVALASRALRSSSKHFPPPRLLSKSLHSTIYIGVGFKNLLMEGVARSVCALQRRYCCTSFLCESSRRLQLACRSQMDNHSIPTISVSVSGTSCTELASVSDSANSLGDFGYGLDDSPKASCSTVLNLLLGC